MVQHFLDQDKAGAINASDLVWPFGHLDGLDEDDLSMAAYEIFFTACRSSPGFGGRNANNFNSCDSHCDGGGGSPAKGKGVGMAVTSKIKMALGLKMMRKRSLTSMTLDRDIPNSPRESSSPSAGGSPKIGFKPTKRPLTSAEIMRQQMKVTEQSDNRLRKTLMRTLVGQMGRRAETVILPLELLRHLKLSEFNSTTEYHEWQRRQLKLLEEGLLHHPSVPIENYNEFVICLQDIIKSSETKPIDTNKNSEAMKTLCKCVTSLAWRSTDNESHGDISHWADGYPLNVHIYIALLRAIFDTRDETMVLDVVDELVELIKKTWPTLGINRSMHNLCFTWVLFEQYVTTGEVEVDLLGASLAMLSEVASDAKKVDHETVYVNMLMATLFSMKKWLEKRLMDYHAYFDDTKFGALEIFLALVFSATKILEEDVPGYAAAAQEDGDIASDLTGNRADLYIRSSLRNAFARMLEDGDINSDMIGEPNASEALLQVAKKTQDLAIKEKKTISSILKKWNPFASGVAAVTLHNCYGTLLKEYLTGSSLLLLSNESMEILHTAGKLEKLLVQMAVEDSVECQDGGQTMVREMVPYGVDSVIARSLRIWIQERLKRVKDLVQNAKESETWNPKSKNEPYGYSALELMKQATQATEEFLEIPVGIAEDLAHTFAHGLEDLFDDYISFVSSCGSKRSYVPTLPPLTRCNKDSKIMKLWRKATPSTVNHQSSAYKENNEGNNNPKLSTSRGTQRLYIRLNSLQYILSQLQVLNKTLSLSPKIVASLHNRLSQQLYGNNYFDQTRSAIQSATQYVSQVAAYRLIFLDSNSVFYGGLYVDNVENARIRPALRILKQNLSLLTAIVIDPVQPLATKEVMIAALEAFLMVLLAGGGSRVFKLADHKMIEEDFDHLKKVFTLGEGLVADEVVEKESEIVEGILELMGESTTKLVHDFTTVACQTSGVGSIAGGQKLPMPPTTGKWQREDANTILRVLCHRNDRAANHFLKSRFQLPRRR